MKPDGQPGTEGDQPARDRVGRLMLVGTPIGNMGDLSPRAAEALASADAIACEDTRRTGRLLSLAGIVAPKLLLANEHTEVACSAEIIERLDRGETVAVVSDAGMPTVSDPGRRIVDSVASAGHVVDIAPGPAAFTTALALSGMDADRFVFEGFLPRKGRARVERLASIASEGRTVVLYEAPHRLQRTLGDLAQACGPDRPAAVGRELTKLHQEVLRSDLGRLVDHFEVTAPRGELVVIVGPLSRPVVPLTDEDLLEALEARIEGGSTRRDAVAHVTASSGEPKRRVYELSTRLGGVGR